MAKNYNDLNITNNNPSYTNNNNINNINYNNRSGSGWTWFKTIFIACMLTIFSVVCFGGGVNSLPKNYTNTIKNEIIRVQTGGDLIYPDQTEIFNKLAPDNIFNYTFEFVNTDNYIPYLSDDSTSQHYIIQSTSSTRWGNLYNNTLGYSGYCYCLSNLTESFSTESVKLNGSFLIGTNKSGRLMLLKNTNGSYKLDYTAFSHPFSFRLFEGGVQYIQNFELFKQWLSNNFIVTNLEIVDTRTYVEYPVKYVTYNWSYKLEQLSYFKNIFTPIFNNNQEKNDLLLQQSFNKLQRWVENGAVEYIGDKQTNNVSYGNNWDYQILLNNNFVALSDYIEFFTSNTGQYINDNYYYNYDTKSFVQYSDVLYGSYNDELSTKEQIINILAYPLSTGFNILFNIGVIFSFILIW